MNQYMLKKLEFNKVTHQLSMLTTTEVGQALVQQLLPSGDSQYVARMLQETEDAVQLLRLKNNIPVPLLKDISVHLKRLAIGGALNGVEMAQIARVLTTTRDVVRFFEQVAQEEIAITYIQEIALQLEVLPALTQQVLNTVAEDGSILDDASPALKGIRQGMKKAEQAIREKLEDILRTKQAQLSDAIITLRNDRYVIPVKQEYRSAFGGMVHDQSASGQTLFIEPQPVLELNNRLRTLHSQEKEEIERLLWELSELLRPHEEAIDKNNTLLGELDFCRAKALYAKQIKAILPQVSKENDVALLDARHPLIDSHKVVANDIYIGKTYQTIVITGPNTGGKTILLKTLGLLQLMAQSGLHIPCRENSQIAVFSKIFADIGDEQSIEQNLSTFSSHMTNIVSILEQIDANSLVLFDELGSGTDPQEGASLAMAILDHLATKGSYVVATTHYPELKAYGYNRVGTINASMDFDAETLQPTYRFLIGVPGRSNAFDISKRLGLEASIIQHARGFIDQDSQDLNEMIADLEQTRQSLEQQQAQVAKDVEKAELLLADVTAGKQYLDEQKAKIEQKAKEEANAIVEKAQIEAERLLSEIRELQLKQGQALVKEHELIDKKTQLANLKHQETLRKNKVLQRAKKQKDVKVGDSVEVISYGQKGTLVEKVSDKQWIVQMGLLKMKVSLDDVVLIEADKTTPKKYVPTLKSAQPSHVSSQLDLRGERYENALVALDKYLDAALLAGYAQVTIVHGKGTGALREGVTKTLQKHRSVASFEYAPIQMGGNGATIVRFKG